ncbi:MAG: biopolymer transporter ExbD [Verrucomicrobiae bacterium]|nr:biopolymer transporter ExbD [Verrucomicrobiae bacterium]
MPVKLGSKLPPSHEARIEIIPLIDIMFFLLAAFMLVSLGMVNLKSVQVNLPTASAATATPDLRGDFLNVSVDRSGALFLDRTPVGPHELVLHLQSWRLTNDHARVFISGDQDARHGDVIRVLDWVRSAGIDRVAFEIREAPAEPRP